LFGGIRSSSTDTAGFNIASFRVATFSMVLAEHAEPARSERLALERFAQVHPMSHHGIELVAMQFAFQWLITSVARPLPTRLVRRRRRGHERAPRLATSIQGPRFSVPEAS